MVARRVKRTLWIVAVIFILISVAAIGFYFGLSYVLSQNSRFDHLDALYGNTTPTNTSVVDEKTPGAVELYIPRAADTKAIAELLADKNVIENTLLFTILSKFNGFDGSYLAGTHFVTQSMSYDEIMYILSQKPNAVRVTFPEGLTYREVKQKLKDAGVKFDEKLLDSMVQNPQLFLEYKFVTQIEKKEGRDWLLQGYLYPDTYEFDMNTDEESIIRTFLDNTESKLIEKYYERAEAIGMTLDEAITLASMVQEECAVNEEMTTVSGVFHNRLKAKMLLGSDAPINYLRAEAGADPKLWLSNADINAFDSPYNDYKYKGLPPGPICTPGELALKAALWPQKHSYYYFVAKGDGTNVFAKTLAQHNANIAKYKK
jgi:UPF0755 protein